MPLMDWSVKDVEPLPTARLIATAKPLTFGKVFLAIVLGNICSGVLIEIVYVIATARR